MPKPDLSSLTPPWKDNTTLKRLLERNEIQAIEKAIVTHNTSTNEAFFLSGQKALVKFLRDLYEGERN